MDINTLASRIEAAQRAGWKYVLMLGAGASRNSGVAGSFELKHLILADVAPGEPMDRFDDIWKSLSEKEQDAALYRHVKGKKPSLGYSSVCKLVEQGYFDIILTFNFDDLLEKTLDERNFKEFDLIVPPREPPTEAESRRRVHSPQPRVKIVKLHGDINSSYYRYSLDQLLEFHEEVKPLFQYLSGLDIIVCGYSFNDLDVLRAMALEGGSMYFVNTEKPSKLVTEILRRRGSAENCIIGVEGDFDRFFAELAERLMPS